MANLVSEQELFFTAFEPKTVNRYVMYVEGVPAYLIKKAERPKLQQEKKKLDHINLQRYVKGKTIWGAMKLELYDPIVPSGAQAVMEWVRLSHESNTGRDGYADFYKKDLTIDVLGPVGDIVSEWVIKGAFIKGGNFGEYNWDTDAQAVNLSLTIGMDYCVLNF